MCKIVNVLHQLYKLVIVWFGYFLISAKQCIPTLTQVSLEELALSEPLSVGLHAVNRASNLCGKKVLISGSGTIGCMVLLAAKLDGAEQVTTVDVLEEPAAEWREKRIVAQSEERRADAEEGERVRGALESTRLQRREEGCEHEQQHRAALAAPAQGHGKIVDAVTRREETRDPQEHEQLHAEGDGDER